MTNGDTAVGVAPAAGTGPPPPRSRPLFTVFTATYNRAHTLDRPYQSLLAQSCRDFEWIVVDDGSSDGTQALIRRWQATAPFLLRYFYQPNRGQQVASNLAVREAAGSLFVRLDSDDALLPEALARLAYHWQTIPDHQRAGFSAVAGLCQDQRGRLVGTRFPRDILDSDNLEIRYRHKVRGDKWGFQRTDVMREYPFPEFAGRGALPPSLVWDAISRRYKTRYVNEIWLTYWLNYGPAAEQATRADPAPGAAVLLLEHQSALTRNIDWLRHAPLAFLRSAVHYSRLSWHANRGPAAQYSGLDNLPARLLWLIGLPIGGVLVLRDRWRFRARRTGKRR